MATEAEVSVPVNGPQLNGGNVDEVAANAATAGTAAEIHVNGNVNGGAESVDESTSAAAAAVASTSSAPGPSSAPAPTYDDIFPALGGTSGGPPGGLSSLGGSGGLGGGLGGIGGINRPASFQGYAGGPTSASGVRGGAAPKLRVTNVTKQYRVSGDDRRGGHNVLNKVCADIKTKTDTTIQVTTSRDNTLTFLITGKEEAVNAAIRMLSGEFQAQITQQLPVPKEHHRFILGKGGRKLADIEQNTGVRIQIPKQDEQSELIRITGTREAIEKAILEIQVISNDAFSRSTERVIIPKVYHPFIVGPFGTGLEAITKETGAKVNVPPATVQKDEITLTGDRNAVLQAKERVLAIYKEKEKRTQTVSIEVKKSQHKYIVGPKGHTLNEIMQVTGVSVEMPPTGMNSETITLRGEPEKLANALSVLYQKAHSETEEEIEVAGWIQRNILGPKGAKFQEMAQDFPKVYVNFDIEGNRIKLTGPVADLGRALETIKRRADEIASTIMVAEIAIADPKHIKFIVGKNGANLRQIREETKANIQVIGDSGEGSSSAKAATTPPVANGLGPQYIRIEGAPEAVTKAKQELEQLLKKLENEVTYELVIERRFYGQIIGQKGENIRDIRQKFNQVQIIFPEQNETSEKVVIRGAKKDAEQCYKHLSQLNKELLFSNYRLEVPILKRLLQFLQGKDSIKNIRDEFQGTRIDLPTDANPDVITITGPRDKVERARDRILSIQSSLADMTSVDILIPAKIHNYMLGAKGRNIKQIMSECGGVLINFPTENSGSDKVQILGPKDCVQKAKQMLHTMSNDYQTNNYSEELKVRVEHHRYLIGKNGANINEIRQKANVRVYFGSDQQGGNRGGDQHHDPEVVTITGKKEDVQKARALLEARIKELDKIIESEMHVDSKYHHLFIARRSALTKQLYDEYGGVNLTADRNTDRIVLKGSKECVEAAKKRIAEIIEDFDAQTTLEVEIDAVHHRSLLGPRNKLSAIQHEFDVRIKFPARPQQQQQSAANKQQSTDGGSDGGDVINGSDDGGEVVVNTDATEAAAAAITTEDDQDLASAAAAAQKAQNTVLIMGRKENCEKARDKLLALVPVTITVSIPHEFHRFIIGQKGAGVRELMDRCNVNIRVPPSMEKCNDISVTGTTDAVEHARTELLEKLKHFEADKADREARSHQVSFHVDPIYHPKIIGKRGAVIQRIRQKYDVNIQVPDSGSGGGKVVDSTTTGSGSGADGENNATDLIVITGYEEQAEKAKEEILAIVKELEDLITEKVEIDSRIHSRLIGTRGANIRKVMNQFKVDIRFPKPANGEDVDLVTISGAQDAVDAAKEHLLERAETFLDDIEAQYQPPPESQFQINFNELSATAKVKESSKGFVVRGGPWEKKKHQQQTGAVAAAADNGQLLDMSNAQEFPAFGPISGGPGVGGGSGTATLYGNGGTTISTTSDGEVVVNGGAGGTTTATTTATVATGSGSGGGSTGGVSAWGPRR